MFRFIFSAICTFFLVSLIRLSFSIPQLFNETNGYRYDFKNEYKNLNERQVSLVTSSFGFFQPHFIISIVLFLMLGIYIYSLPKKNMKKFRKAFQAILSSGFAIAGTLVTIFSIWRA